MSLRIHSLGTMAKWRQFSSIAVIRCNICIVRSTRHLHGIVSSCRTMSRIQIDVFTSTTHKLREFQKLRVAVALLLCIRFNWEHYANGKVITEHLGSHFYSRFDRISVNLWTLRWFIFGAYYVECNGMRWWWAKWMAGWLTLAILFRFSFNLCLIGFLITLHCILSAPEGQYSPLLMRNILF